MSRYSFVAKPSHQTPDFPPTHSIHSTSRVSIRMIRTKYCTLTVIEIHANLLHVLAATHLFTCPQLIHSRPPNPASDNIFRNSLRINTSKTPRKCSF